MTPDAEGCSLISCLVFMLIYIVSTMLDTTDPCQDMAQRIKSFSNVPYLAGPSPIIASPPPRCILQPCLAFDYRSPTWLRTHGTLSPNTHSLSFSFSFNLPHVETAQKGSP